jgi:CMP-N-acetylneuraminic acid synthetase
MLEIAKQKGCEAVKRNEYYASNYVSMSDVYKNMAENINCDIIVYTNVTNPLIKDKTIINSINKFMEIKDTYNSLNSAHLIKCVFSFIRPPFHATSGHECRSIRPSMPEYPGKT